MGKLQERARELGYKVEPVREGSTALLVEGFNISTYYEESDDDAWKALLKSHESRAKT